MKPLCDGAKKDVLLINPLPGYKFIMTQGIEIPMGLACLASYLDMNSISTGIIDMQIHPQPYNLLAQTLKENKLKIIGISSNTVSFHKAVELARWIKCFDSKIFIVIGGVHASALPKETMHECSYFDCLVYGEGELTLYELVDNLIRGKDISNLQGTVMRIDGQIKTNPPRPQIEDIDSLPFPAREKFELDKYRPGHENYLRLPATSMMTTRGCPFKCTFCSTPNVWSHSFRLMSAERVLKEIIYCKDRFGIRDFIFNDDTFTVSRTRVTDICNMFINNKLDISWGCYARVDTVEPGILFLMKEAGCLYIRYGIEVGTEESLGAICKGTTLKQARDAVHWTKKSGIDCFASFMLGIPGEEPRDTEKTVLFAKELTPDLAEFRRFLSFPGSKMFEQKILPFNADTLFCQSQNNVFFRMQRRAYLSYYLFPRWILQMICKFFKYPKRQMRIFYHGVVGFLQRIKPRRR
jgi:radical SAM superfamily enzyme YgiQ (UPF0313 family)